jgi:DNA-directed RNA polymerase subunit RPC12/RpoP
MSLAGDSLGDRCPACGERLDHAATVGRCPDCSWREFAPTD